MGYRPTATCERCRAMGGWLVVSVCLLALAPANDLRLIHAIRSQNAELARELVADGVDVNATQGDGATALHWAAHRDDLETLELLISSGAYVNAVNDLGATPLQVACVNGSGSMVERLLTVGADATAELLNGETALMTCARTGNTRSVRALLGHGAKVNATEAGHQQTALMWAAAQGHAHVVRRLVEAGADVRARSLTYPQTVVDEQTQRAGREELNYSVLRGGSTALLFAARNGDVASAAVLLEAGAEPNDALSDGMSALVLAAHSGHGELGIALLQHGANPNNIGIGYTALHAAVLRGQLELVEALLASGADPNLRMVRGTPIRRQTTDYNLPKTLVGMTPYLLAAKFLEPAIMRALVAGHADTRLATEDGTTPLMFVVGMGSRRGSRRGIAPIDVGGAPAAEREILEAVVAAIELGADVNARDGRGDTALHVAAINEQVSVIRALVDGGADVAITNANGLTPLDVLTSRLERRRQPTTGVASELDSNRTVRVLRELGAARP